MKPVRVIFIVSLLFLVVSSAFGLTTEELVAVRDGFEARRDSILAEEISGTRPYLGVTWTNFNYAISALYLNQNLSTANSKIIQVYTWYMQNPELLTAEFGFHWIGNMACRIYEYFNHDSEFFPGRLSTEAEYALTELMWQWAKVNSKISDAETAVSKTWYIWGSENHDAMHDSTCWGASRILSSVSPYNGFTFDDGHTAAEHYAAWTEFHKEYLRERGKKGLLIEVGSKYGIYTLQGWYNLYDFSEDAALKYLAGATLDLWWTDFAHDQIDAVRGGGKSRVYQLEESELARYQSSYSMCWYYLGIGEHYPELHRATLCLATSSYRLPLVVTDIALDTVGRGSYEYKSRRPGLGLNPEPAGLDPNCYAADPDFGGIFRYSYCTPDFVMGTCMVEKRNNDDWTLISSQNRWHGVIFKGDADSRIFVQCKKPGTNNDTNQTYNQQWSVQNKGTLICQKLSTSINSLDMRVWFSNDLVKSEESGWVFAEAQSAYAAVRPVSGGYVWDDANWLRCIEEYTPVIVEVARSSDFATLGDFKAAVLKNSLSYTSGVLNYTGLMNNGEFTFYAWTEQVPEINGAAVDYTPAKTFDSPFISEDWAEGRVVISKDQRRLTLNFNFDGVQSPTDLNDDTIVDFYDFSIFTKSWLKCTDPQNSNCMEVTE